MVNGIRESDPRGLNKERGSKFRVGSRVRQETPEEGRRTYRSKRCEYNHQDEDDCPKTLNDKNPQALSQKFRQLKLKDDRKQWIKLLFYFLQVFRTIFKWWFFNGD